MKLAFVGALLVGAMVVSAAAGCRDTSNRASRAQLCAAATAMADTAIAWAEDACTQTEKHTQWTRKLSPVKLPPEQVEKLMRESHVTGNAAYTDVERYELQRRRRSLESFPGDGPAYAAAERCDGARQLFEYSLRAVEPLVADTKLVWDLRHDSAPLIGCSSLKDPYDHPDQAEAAITRIGAWTKTARAGWVKLARACAKD